jgi:hypothetical protein
MSGTKTVPRPVPRPASPRRAPAMPRPAGPSAGKPAGPAGYGGRRGTGPARQGWTSVRPGPHRSPAAQGPQKLPFIVLLIVLLAGALVCILVISTTLAEGSFRISTLRQADNALARQQEQLQQQVASEQAPAMIAQRAEQLGMRPPGVLRFINLRPGRIATTSPAGAEHASAGAHVPGTAP